jgi:hypothetical protein
MVKLLETTFYIKIFYVHKRFNSPRTPLYIVIPSSLVPFVLALYHYKTHSNAKKLLSAIRLKYYWKNMKQDVKAFCKGCVLYNINKFSLLGKSELGTTRLVFQPFDNSKIRNQRNKQVKRVYHS